MELRCKSFYTLLECGEKARLEDVIFSDNIRWALFYETLTNVNAKLVEKDYEGAYHMISSLNYDRVSFEYPFLSNHYCQMDQEYLHAYVEWFIANYSSYSAKLADKITLPLPEPITVNEVVIDSLTCNPTFHLHNEKEELIVFCSYNLRGFSKKGRKINTSIDNMLDLVAAKSVYPDANILYVSIRDIKDIGALNAEPKLTIQEVLNQLLKQKCNKNCSMCSYSYVCQSLTLSPTYVEQVKKVETEYSNYELPKFDEYQTLAINSQGKVKVYAGPGSGKTATLVGRVNHLVNELNVAPENILLLSFTNKAVDELKERTSYLLPKNRECFISTIDSLCSYILSDNKHLHKMKINIQMPEDKKRLLYDLSKCYQNMKGFNYNKIFGANGFIDMLSRRVTDFLTNYRDIPEIFAEKHGVDKDFFELANEYDAICEKLGYVTFDEQLLMTIDLLKNNKNVLNNYKKIWRYIMVDEYQDISQKQDLLIRLLSDKEVFIVGDDDQSIFDFRGGSSIFMHQFEADKTIVLTHNYRSTANIVNLALKNVENISDRMQKVIITVKEGTEPDIINSSTPEEVNNLIKSLLESNPGMKLHDIAILSAYNQPLYNLAPLLNYPCIMGKNYIIKSPLFALFTSLLSIKTNNYIDDLNLYHIVNCLNHSYAISLINIKDSLLNYTYKKAGIEKHSIFDYEYFEKLGSNEELNFYAEILCFISSAMKDLDTMDITSFILELANVCSLNDTYVLDSLLDIIEKKNFYSLEQIYSYFNSMRSLEDTTRYEINWAVDAVNLLTIHESKGKEFSAVILYETDNIISEKEKNIVPRKNLAYVGMTRAKNNLFILSNGDTQNNRFLRELI